MRKIKLFGWSIAINKDVHQDLVNTGSFSESIEAHKERFLTKVTAKGYRIIKESIKVEGPIYSGEKLNPFHVYYNFKCRAFYVGKNKAKLLPFTTEKELEGLKR